MNLPDPDDRPRAGRTLPLDLPDLYQLFDQPTPRAVMIQAESVPQPYKDLLVHEAHMTVTLEKYWDTRVTLEVLERRHRDPLYARKILLRHGESGLVVQFGIMQFDFTHCSARVRDEILQERTPLGRILIENRLLRRISTHAILEIEPDPEIAAAFNGPSSGQPPEKTDHFFGRLATIYVDEKPAVALLEVVRTE